MKSKSILILCLLLFIGLSQAAPIGTAFTYQGELKQSGVNANGAFDFKFEMFNVDVGGMAIGSLEVLLEDVNVVDGVFTVDLDFTSEPFAGDQLWLAIGVRDGASFDPHTVLLPRQKITAVPYALHAEFVAMNAVGSAEVDSSEVQLRIGDSCAIGSSIRAIGSDGTVTCEVDNTGGDITAVTGNTQIVVTSSSGPVPALSIGSDSLTSAHIEASAIGASELATGAVTDIDVSVTAAIAPTKIANTAAVLTFTDLQSFSGTALVIDGLNDRVGVDMTTPQYPLDVTGRIHTTTDFLGDSFQYETDPTFHHNVPPVTFITEVSGDIWELDGFGAYRFVDNEQSFSANIESFAPVNLPAFATVTEFACHYYDNKASAVITSLTADLYVRSNTSTANTKMATATLSISTNSTAVRTITDTSIASATTSNAAQYWIEVNMNVSEANTSLLRFYGCRVSYTMSQVASP